MQIEHATLLSLNDRERDTVLAALAAWRRISVGKFTGRAQDAAWEIAYAHGQALSSDEITALAERLAK